MSRGKVAWLCLESGGGGGAQLVVKKVLRAKTTEANGLFSKRTGRVFFSGPKGDSVFSVPWGLAQGPLASCQQRSSPQVSGKSGHVHAIELQSLKQEVF